MVSYFPSLKVWQILVDTISALHKIVQKKKKDIRFQEYTQPGESSVYNLGEPVGGTKAILPALPLHELR